ncbi:hypothetical protein ACFSHT_10255 [Paraburkholderia silviterrae]|nr:hypothetical protein [Paraburkholderia silviterrae]
MNRIACDNALLLACHDFSGRVALGCKVIAVGAAVGIGWWLLVAIRAGA